MRPKSLALLLLAVGCGLVASLGISEVIARRNAESTVAVGDTQSIFVAMTDIGLGDLLTSQVLKLEQWPKDKVPGGAITRMEDVEGRRARTKLYAGEPILENRLLGKGASEQGATALIPKGYRVVPVKVDLVSGGSSLILPGDRVDVMVHLVKDPGRDIPETVTRTILQDIKVFAVDNIVDLEKEKDPGKSISAKTICLLVTPDQAAKVMLATQLGTINLVMRSPEDEQQGNNAQARPSELFGGGSRSERSKETLMAPSEPGFNEKTNGLLDLLNSMKGKTPTVAAAVPAGEPKPRPMQTWTVRVLKPGSVDQVEFEAQETAGPGSPMGTWKATTLTGSPAGARPAAEESKAVAPPAQTPAAPTAEKPSSPRPQPKTLKKDNM